MIQTHAKLAPLDFINQKNERETQVFLPKPNIPFLIKKPVNLHNAVLFLYLEC